MSDVVIKVENLSKKYTIPHGKGQQSGDGLRHAISDAVSAPFRKFKAALQRAPSSNNSDNQSRSSAEEFYALNDISFEVKSGEVVGIVGRNGAGKSTLLKILSRITEPSSGRIGLKGRVASLLEVGTGFHPELTGRENIYLNGAILGMTRSEVRYKFEEIVDFSGVEKFLDTPVKRYSSGMYVRLAFAVAAHLEPDILIIDEVLAVGDSQFQSKCIGKMKEVSTSGRTVLFVSHNLPSMVNLCDRGILLDTGAIIKNEKISSVVASYVASATTTNNKTRRSGSGEYRIKFVRCEPSAPSPHETKTFTFECTRVSSNSIPRPFLILEVLNDSNVIVARCDTRLTNEYLEGQMTRGKIIIKSPWLKPGIYTINAYIDTGYGLVDLWENSTSFHVIPNLPYIAATSPDAYERAAVLCDFSSEISSTTEDTNN